MARQVGAVQAQRQEKTLFFNTNTLMVIVVTGVALMLVGFGFRDRNFGLVLMGVGLITAIISIIYTAILNFS